jgi:hypothetical protein
MRGIRKIDAVPLIYQNFFLTELAPSSKISSARLPRFHRADPSTSLDKSTVGVFNC